MARISFRNHQRRPLEPVTDGEVRRAVEKFDNVFRARGILGAAAFSRTCFVNLSKKPAWPAFDYCVAFDLVAQQIDKAAASEFNTERLGYFEDARVKDRHESAIRSISGESFGSDTERLRDVADRTQEQLRALAILQGRNAASSDGAAAEKGSADVNSPAQLNSLEQMVRAAKQRPTLERSPTLNFSTGESR